MIVVCKMMKYIFYPDRSTKLLKVYHWSSKAMLPLLGLSLGSEMIDGDVVYKKNDHSVSFKDCVHGVNVLNVGFHSYVSVSNVIVDYVKHANASRLCRLANLQGHLLAAGGFLYIILKK
jgi:hypothetical protein